MKLMQALRPWADARLIVWYYGESFEEILKSRGQSVDLHLK
jgi:hypothetical protein